MQTASGLVIQHITEGTGASPTPSDTVKVHYQGTCPPVRYLTAQFSGEPISFLLNGVIAGWTEGSAHEGRAAVK